MSADDDTPGARRRSRRLRTLRFALCVFGTAAAGAALSGATPTGLSVADEVWTGALVAVTAYFAGTARRWTWFLPALAAAAVAGDTLAVGAGGVAVAVGLWSVITETRSRARGAFVVGLGVAALLRADPVGFHGATALLTAVAVAPAIVSGYRHASSTNQARARRLAGVGGGIGVLMLAGVVLGVVSVAGDLTSGGRAIDDGLAAARDTDEEEASARLGQAARDLSAAEATLTSWFVSPARVLPVVGPNLGAVSSLSREASGVAEVSSTAAASSDVEALRFVDGRLDPQAVADLQRPLGDAVDALRGFQETVDAFSPYESPWLVAPLSHRLERLQGQLDDALPEAEVALAGVEMGPSLLGSDGPKRYLVLFTTPVEARGRSGFPGNFAELLIDDGRLSMPRFGRISELEQGGVPGPQRTLQGPPDYVARYDRFDPAWTWRNITMSPDFPSIAEVAANLYPVSGGQPVDGVLAVDPVGLAALLRYTGPVTVDGLAQPLTPENAAQFLLLDQYVQFTDVSQRVDVLEQVARTTFERLTIADLPGPSAISEQIDPVIDGGHIQFWTFELDQNMLFAEFDFWGGMNQLDGGDYLAVTSSNAGGSKIDLFLERTLGYTARWDPDSGEVAGTITSTLANRAPAAGLPDYVIGNTVGLPPGTNRSFVTVYTPFEATGARLNGQPVALEAGTELGRRAYSAFVEIPPGGTVTLEVDVRGAVEGPYRLDIDQQPLVVAEQGDIAVEVAGNGAVRSGSMAVDGRTARWAGPVDHRVGLSLRAD